MDDAENEVLAYMDFPRAHWLQIHSTNPLERLNAEIKRRTNVVGIFPNDAAITRLVGAMLLEQNDEWSLNRRYMQLEGLQSLSDTAPTRVSAIQGAECRASQPFRAHGLTPRPGARSIKALERAKPVAENAVAATDEVRSPPHEPATTRGFWRNRTKKSPNREWLGLRDWWSRRESNPRPQAITGQFYMRSWLV